MVRKSYFDVFDPDKAEAIARFNRGGGPRRQDHASRGNGHRGHEYDPWLNSKEADMDNLRKRKLAQQGGLTEEE